MKRFLLKHLINFQGIIFLLSMTALACLPIALSKLVRDAFVSLLLPLTFLGVVLAWAFAGWRVRSVSSGLVFLFLGPLVLFLRLGQMGDSLFEFIKQSLNLIPALYNGLFYETPYDPSTFLSARAEFLQKVLTLGGRLVLWGMSLVRGTGVEDPVIRTLIWSLGLWLIAAWAGWQIYRNKRFMAGMFPSTVLLVFILEYTGEEKTILWLHLALLFFLYGLTHYHHLRTRWDALHTDYSESTAADTLLLTGALTLGLLSISYFVSTVSIKDILDDLREKRAASTEAGADSLGLEPAPVKENFRVTGIERGLPRSHLLTAGPELSTQLVMTISTGELPPMPQSANPIVPRYYWRTLVYTVYTGGGWTIPALSAEDVPADQPLMEETNPNQRVIQTEVTFPDDRNDRLYWAGTLVHADVPFKAIRIYTGGDGSIPNTDMLAAMATVESYHAESVLLNVSVQELRKSPSVYPAWVRNQFLALPDSVPERVRALARDLTASEPTVYDRALAIQNYLRQFPYTLDVSTPPSGRDVADYFLFDLKQGYCDYYATAMVVLARAAGLPARLVVGYANGAYNTERAQYIVTEDYAHSWVEIYFTDIGWVEFEPTAGQPAIIYEEKMETVPLAEEGSSVERSLAETLSFLLQFRFKNAWIPAALILICGLLWIGVDSLRLKRMSPSQTIQLLYKRLRRLARPVTGSASRSQTAHSYAFDLVHRLSAFENSSYLQNWLVPAHHEITQLTELFSHSLFAPLAPTRSEADDAIKAWSRLRWRLVLANLLGSTARFLP